MSTPSNPLAQHTSYSYKHLLMVCNTSAVASHLENTNNYSDIIADSQSRSVVAINSLNKNNTPEGYVVLINGFIDADLSIETFNINNVIAPASLGNSPATTLATSGSISILEPFGARFYQILQTAFDDLGADANGLIFVIKTFFFGHSDSQTPISINTKPITFIPIDIKSSFGVGGASYDMQFVSITNGASRLPFALSGGTMSFTSKGVLLSNAITQCEHKLNERATRDYLEFTKDSNKTGRRIKYRITLDNIYKSNDYTVSNPKVSNLTDGNSVQFSFGKNASIDQMIDKIMRSSKHVESDASNTLNVGEGDNPKRHTYKILTNINYTMEDCEVHYHIARQQLVYGTVGEIFSGNTDDVDKGDVLEFDYMFSGKNIDIINFDIKMDMGLAFLQQLGIADNIPNGCQSLGETALVSDNTGGIIDKPTISARTMNVVGSADYKNPSNTNNSKQSAAFDSMLSRWAAIEQIECKLEVYGNPLLLNDITLSSNEISNPENDSPWDIYPSVVNKPSLVRINIFMPKTPDPTNVEIEPFWYRGYYFIYEVDSDFSGGEFTQILSLMALPVNSLDLGAAGDTDICN